MQIIEKDLQINIPEIYKNSLFFDIETTGLKIETTHLYLFGCVFFDDGKWHFKQWLLESPFEERSAIREINDFAAGFETFITFNGERFDIPYMDWHAKAVDVDSCFTRINSLDIYRHVKCCKNFFNLPRGSQKCFESFIGNNRLDEYDGGRLISVYYKYCKTGSDELLKLLLLHNEEDVLGMTSLINLLPYEKLFCCDEAVLAGAPEIIKKTDSELLISLPLTHNYPYKTSCRYEDYYLSLGGDRLNIKIPVFTGVLRFFFFPSRDYYYLPSEDYAIHKSVGTYVDPGHRVQATPATCYAKKESAFIPLFSPDTAQVYRMEYNTRPYAEITEKLLSDKKFWNSYLHEILDKIRKLK